MSTALCPKTVTKRFLHFSDNFQNDPNDVNRDMLYKVRPLVDNLVSKFKRTYIPEREITIDKELRLWKGRLAIKQYVPLKLTFIKISFCETFGYLWNSYI